MPQLDKLIFFFENIGFVLSFFGLVFYNQYYFYPQLLKNLFIRKQLLTNDSINQLIVLFKSVQTFPLVMNFSSIQGLQTIFLNNSTNFFKKLKLFFIYKYNNYLKLSNLFLNKFFWIFISFFFEMYRSYIEERDYKHEFRYEDYLKDAQYI